MTNILAVGIATLDIINTIDAYPTEDSEVRALSQQKARGGNATNTLTVLRQLGHHCSWAGVLIDEPDSQIIKQDLAHYVVDISACKTIKTGKMPTSYISLNKQTGSRSIVHYRDCPEFSFDDFRHINLQQYSWVHFEGRNITETRTMLQYLQQYHPCITRSVEIEKPRDDIETLFDYADILFFSHHYAQDHGFATATELLTSLKQNILASCTWGQQGAWIITDDKQLLHSPIFPPAQLVDTLGAGDTFNAGLIDSLVNGFDPQQSLIRASQLAGHKCGQQGFANLLHNFQLN